MKKYIYSAIFVFSIGLGINSCKKEFDSKIEVNTSSENIASKSSNNKENCEKSIINGSNNVPIRGNFKVVPKINKHNPYDFMGKIHNEIVEEVILSYNLTYLDPDILFKNATNITKSKSIDTLKCAAFFDIVKIRELIDFDEINLNFPIEQLDKFDNENELSIKAKNYVRGLYNLIDLELDNLNPNVADYQKLSSKIITTENLINADSEIRNNERIILLSAFSIARYSLALSLEIILNSPVDAVETIDWRRVGKADIGGALAGAGGSILSGGVGIIGFTVTGAASASLGSILNQWLFGN